MPISPIVEELRARALYLWLAWLSLLLCFVLIQPAQFIHPFSWGDDIAWEVDPGFYGAKLRQEGRWIVFAWIKTLGLGSAAFDYKLLIGLWCGTALAVAVAASGTRRPFTLLVAIALAVNPSAWALTLWPHTALPMIAVLAVCGLGVALAADERSRLRSLFVAWSRPFFRTSFSASTCSGRFWPLWFSGRRTAPIHCRSAASHGIWALRSASERPACSPGSSCNMALTWWHSAASAWRRRDGGQPKPAPWGQVRGPNWSSPICASTCPG